MPEAGYEERYCLFLDILGFQSHIDESVSSSGSNTQMSFINLLLALRQISEGVNYREKIWVSGEARATSRMVTQFSDSVVISYLKSEKNGHGVHSILMDVHNLQLKLISKGILLRGAVTAGLLYHGDDQVFGPALNEAVALERLANYPRVILDREILDEAGLLSKPKDDLSRTISSMVREDFDGIYYVDYFNVHPDDFGEDWNDLAWYLEKLRELIRQLAHKKTLSLKMKHSWLRTKFNQVAMQLQSDKYERLGPVYVPEEDIEVLRLVKPFK